MIAAMEEKTHAGILGTLVGDRDISKRKICTASSALLSSTQRLHREMTVSCSSPGTAEATSRPTLGTGGEPGAIHTKPNPDQTAFVAPTGL